MKSSLTTLVPVICFLLSLAPALAQRHADPGSLPDAPMVRTAPTPAEAREII